MSALNVEVVSRESERLNLATLQRWDANISQIRLTATHTVLYHFNHEKKGKGGNLTLRFLRSFGLFWIVAGQTFPPRSVSPFEQNGFGRKWKARFFWRSAWYRPRTSW